MQRKKITAFAANSRLAAIGSWGDWANDGFLLTYGPDVPEAMRRVAVYSDKVLRGERPGDLPIERPTRFELVVNLKTAKALGLTISPTLLARADRVIE
jgi:putative ABC transport system substrate-binding protein